MKPKKFSRKLFLNKKTIVNLDGTEMRVVEGGAGDAGMRCDSCKSTFCHTMTCTHSPDTFCGTICNSNPCC
ncbi:MAG: class I lanthipeptide [Candidatus Aminicenantes bacterium]|nr:MAG: class I lanthipeptide [Candidatus Aminicenantes bacterium]